MASVTVLVTRLPFRTRRAAEALRMSVGLTLADNAVRLILAGDAAYILGEAKPDAIGGGDVERPLETLRMLGHSICAEAESLDERGLIPAVKGVESLSRSEVAKALADSDVVLTW